MPDDAAARLDALARAASAHRESVLILVDTSVWVDHLRLSEPGLIELLERSAVVMHPFVVGEIACGSLRDRSSILELLQDLPAAVVAESE
jgi:predicted nucleic acid-binding protein